jgi:NAD(P)-dependent dehydrogenase (short-subunit alcohol dehydrogenase family)
MSDGLRGKTALVTGGSRGIGESIARDLAAAGMNVIVTARTGSQADLVADDIGGRALIGDVSDRGDVARWVAEAGPVDLLVCNAGMLGPQEAFGDPGEWWRTFEVNVLGVYLCCAAFVPGMQGRGEGRIITITSGAAFVPNPPFIGGSTAYGASKAALNRFTELLARELAPSGVFAFVVGPGMIKTEMNAHFPDDAPWADPDLTPRLIRAIATGEFDALAGRHLHAITDAPERLRGRTDEILDQDLNAIRLR